MKILRYSFVLLLVCISAIAVESFWPGKVLGKEDVRQKWGSEKFDIRKFHDGDEKARASMTYDLLINQKNYYGESISDIRNTFGEFSGFYFSDVYPTYLIDEGKKKGDSVWQIVFLMNKNRKINKIIVHKNCCG